MGKLLRVLEKVGLVELDGRPAVANAEVDMPIEPVMVQTVDAEPVRAFDAAALDAARAGAPAEQRPFEEIYAEHSVASAPFSADKLLRILDGLAALDPASRKAAVLALDAADDSWSIDDVLLDAERKTRALDMAKRQLEAHARAALQQAREAIEAREKQQQDAVSRIRQQIADLEALLEREVTRATEEKARLDAEARGTKDACLREFARIEQESARLGRIALVFAAETAPAPDSP